MLIRRYGVPNDLRYLRLRFVEWQPVLYFVKPLKELNVF